MHGLQNTGSDGLILYLMQSLFECEPKPLALVQSAGYSPLRALTGF